MSVAMSKRMIHLYEGLTHEDFTKLMKMWLEDKHPSPRVEVEARMMCAWIFHEFWESVMTGKPVDRSWYEGK